VRPYLEKSFTKKADGVAQGVGPEFKTQHYTHTHTHKYTGLEILAKAIRQEKEKVYK
jgi:hypothetical protein